MPLYSGDILSCICTLEEFTAFYICWGRLTAVILALSEHQIRITQWPAPSAPCLSPQSSLPPPKGDSSLASPQQLRKHWRKALPSWEQNKEVCTWAAGIFTRNKCEWNLGGNPQMSLCYTLQSLSSEFSKGKATLMGNEEVFTCPMRCARSMACRSLIGFQSCSTNTTVSAPVKLSPSPPTWVVSKRTSIDGSLLNLHTRS